MSNQKAYHIVVEGSSYEAGRKLGNKCISIPGFVEMNILKEAVFTKDEEKEMYKMFDEFCPGINEEVAGFADVLKVPTGQVLYYMLSYLRPGCSQMAVLPSKTANGHVLMARNYDFGDEIEEMVLCTTRIKDKYAHTGSAIVQFGRADGMNEHGLAISQTSAGLPVANFKFARKPQIKGLQFWAVIRSLLENCKNVDEAVNLAMEMPIAYNINLLAADKAGNAALIESFDGKKAKKRIGIDTKEQYICSTNHIHLEELKHFDPLSMRNSVVRYELMNKALKEKDAITGEDLKVLLSKKYPEGLCCHFYEEFFGNLRGMIFDLNDGTIEVCFGSTALNGWHSFKAGSSMIEEEYAVVIEKEKAPQGFYEMI